MGIIYFFMFIGISFIAAWGTMWIAEKFLGIRLIGRGSSAAQQAYGQIGSDSETLFGYEQFRPELVQEATSRCKRKAFALTSTNVLNEIRRIERENNLTPLDNSSMNDLLTYMLNEDSRKLEAFGRRLLEPKKNRPKREYTEEEKRALFYYPEPAKAQSTQSDNPEVVSPISPLNEESQPSEDSIKPITSRFISRRIKD